MGWSLEIAHILLAHRLWEPELQFRAGVTDLAGGHLATASVIHQRRLFDFVANNSAGLAVRLDQPP